MKKAFIVILLFSLSGIGGFAQEQTEKMRKNSVSASFSRVAPKIYGWAVDMHYHRNIWRGLGVGVGYQYYKAEYIYDWYWGVSSFNNYGDITVHSGITRVDYSIPFLNHFAIGAFGQLGLDWKSYNYQDSNLEQIKSKDNAFSYGGGLFLEYHYSAFSVCLIHEYCHPKLKENYLKENIDDKEILIHRKTGLAVAYSF